MWNHYTTESYGRKIQPASQGQGTGVVLDDVDGEDGGTDVDAEHDPGAVVLVAFASVVADLVVVVVDGGGGIVGNDPAGQVGSVVGDVPQRSFLRLVLLRVNCD